MHKQAIKRKAILKLDTDEEGLIEGHVSCAQYLESKARELLESPAELDPQSQQILLSEITPSITDDDNKMMEALPTKDEIFQALSASNLSAAAGSDGIPGLLYKECWDILDNLITEIITKVLK